jgi:tetraacyldisaccharide 4'-kinase
VSASRIERIWYEGGLAAGLARAALAPASWGFAGVTAIRNALYDHGILRSHVPALPVLSLGNLSVGGTGKTPMTAWAAARLRERGANPAVVLRGYGEDEPLVHLRLNPEVAVITDADRVRGVRRARELGADCAVLDDAFQHRRIRRMADWVLVAADGWRAELRPLPAGPLRESARSLARADLLVVTRKSASRDQAEAIVGALAPRLRHGAAVAICHLAPYAIVDAVTARREPLSWLQARSFAAIAAIGAPDAFFAQLRAAGAVLETFPFPDHHAFDAHDVERIVRAGERGDGVLCTLKDAVKLAPRWPRAGPALWYVSQRAVIERGGEALDASLDLLLAARTTDPQTAGTAGPSSPAHGHRSSTADR